MLEPTQIDYHNSTQVAHHKKMSAPRRWMSSKVHRKSSSKSSLSSHLSSSPLDDSNNNRTPHNRAAPRSPPTRLPAEEDATTDTTATTIVDFGSGSTLVTHKSSNDGLQQSMAVGSYSSIETTSTGLTPSPSTTPPKKTWEKNYKSFLKRSGVVKQSSKASSSSGFASSSQHHTVPSKLLPRVHVGHHHHGSNKPSRTLSSENATNSLPRVQQQPPIPTHENNEDFATPSLADGFGDHSHHNSQPSLAFVGSSAPSSPIKPRESNTRGGTFFKRLRSKTKSADSLAMDATMRKGIDRTKGNSPTTTPPGSIINAQSSSTPATPVNNYNNKYRSSPQPGASSCPGATMTTTTASLQEGLEKAAVLSEFLCPPTLMSSNSFGSHITQQQLRQRLEQKAGAGCYNSSSHQGDNHGSNDGNNLDQARHRGHSVSMAPSTMMTMMSQAQTTTPIPTNTAIPTATLRSRVQSMGSNLIIPEGEPVINHNKEEKLERERRKAFTDFHHNGIDSSSAYLGDESSLHRHSMFLGSMAYPAGSAGGKVNTRRTFSHSGAHSMDQKREDSISSTSMNATTETNPQHKESADEISPGRALKALKGPEHWKKGERHAIFPGVLCMCPIQVLNNIMSKDEEPASSRPSPTSRGGIGSMISQDDGVDSSNDSSNGWFFADHHHQPSTAAAAGGTLPRYGSIGGGGSGGGNILPSAFGKIYLGKATAAPLGMRSFLGEVYGWCTGVFVLRQNYLFEYREGDSLNGLPHGYAQLQLAEAYPHNHFTNALHLDFFEKPCSKSGKRSLLLRVENKVKRDRWVSLLQSAARMTMHDLYDVDESDGAPEFGRGRYAVVRPAKRKDWRKVMTIPDPRYMHATNSQDSFRNVPSCESLGGCNKSSNTDLEKGTDLEYDCALKIIDKKEFWSCVRRGRERVDTLVREAAVQTTLAVKGADVPGFLRLINIFETEEHLVLELELLKGIDLFQHVSSHGDLSEVEAAQIMRDLLNCLNVLDQVGIAHRDIKPANLLMCHDENIDGTKIKLADYGMASFVGVDNLIRGRCGTPGFVAPEILLMGVNGGYGNKVDMFSAGVTLYVMLSGYEPFYGESDAELIDANREAKVDFPHADWHSVSIEGRDLIERMLVVDPAKRIGPSEALRHPWITRRAALSRKEDCK